MCGRTCLTLSRQELVTACKYHLKEQIPTSNDEKSTAHDADKQHAPEWRAEFNCGRTYQPSQNIAPTGITPVLVSLAHFDENPACPPERLIVPMMWGMIPFWHKGDYRHHRLSTNNCRLEHLLESKLYRGPFERGQRCVVLCEGYYEWQTTKTAKPSERSVFMVSMPQQEGIKIYDRATWNESNVNLVKMAGLFDVWEDENGDRMYSYSVITLEASKEMSFLHHRMPAILENEAQINDWLDFSRVKGQAALDLLKQAPTLQHHQVSKLVSNSRQKSDQCNKPIDQVVLEQPKPPMNKTMAAWLNVRKIRENELMKRAVEEDSDDDYKDDDPKRSRFGCLSSDEDDETTTSLSSDDESLENAAPEESKRLD